MITTALLLLQAAMPGSTVAARVESLLARAEYPREGDVAVITTASADTVYVGDQVEILTAAWFPTAIRERLRRPPTLRPPSLNGVWSLPVVIQPGVAARREVGETSYDLYASHQVVFPVTPGRLVIPAADLAFSSPSSRQFFGDEQREERRSRERTIIVLPLPTARRPEGFAGPVGRGLQVSWRIATPNARVGELLPVDLLVSGEGNLSLWGPPDLEWPDGVRVYPDEDSERPGWRGARLAGTRQFRFLLLPDSAGSVTLPEIRYPHFDPLQRSYRTAVAAPVLIPILPARTPSEIRSPPPLLLEVPPHWTVTVVERWGPALAAGLLLAPLVALGSLRWRRREAGVVKPLPAQALTRFDLVLTRLAGPMGEREPARMGEALRRMGVEVDEADRAVQLHARIRALRYARPESRQGSEQELAEESARWLARLPARLMRRALAPLLLLLAVGMMIPAQAQAPSPSRLYGEGAWEAAIRAQAASMTPGDRSATAWYNLGAMRWMAHHDAGAAAAWLEAVRRAPRNSTIRGGWNELALRHQQVRDWAPTVPVTPEELIVPGAVLWLLASVVLAWGGPRHRATWLAGAAALVLLAVGGVARGARQATQGFTVTTAPLRAAPHGLAESTGTVDGIILVTVEARDGAWVRVRDPRGRPGWLPASAVVMVRGLD